MTNCLRAWMPVVLLSLAATVFAQNNIQVTVNGQPVAFDQAGPQMMNGRVLVPLRGVMEQIGAYVQWDAASHTVTATKAGSNIQLRIGDRTATVNGQPVSLDVPAMIIGGSTMVPLRFVGESLGADVRWDAPSNTVAIITSGNNPSGGDVNNYTPSTTGGGSQVVRVNSFMHNATGWVTPQNPVHFSMEGTPGGQAYLYIPGISAEMPMRETTPGHYEADWAPPLSSTPLSVRDAAPVARLVVNGQQQYLQAKSNIQVDTEPPAINSIDPAPDSTILSRPQITVSYADAGSGIDPTRTRIFVNGNDVTSQATVTPGYLSLPLANNLAPGVYHFRVMVYDRAGNVTDKSWDITATGQTGNATILTHNGGGQLMPGQNITFNVSAPPGSQVAVAIGHRINVPLYESSPGKFTGTYTVKSTDVFSNDPVGARVIPPRGRQYLVQSFQPLGYTSPTATGTVPVITSPTANQSISDPLIVQGVALPNSTVEIHVSYSTMILGIFRSNGSVADVTAFADQYGNFTARPISLTGFSKGSNTSYTITAVTVLPDGTRSAPATLMLRD